MRNRLTTALFVFLSIVALAAQPARADDWPQWLGPNRDGIWRETGLLQTFPEQGLKVNWRAPVGAGYSGPAVAGGRVFVTDRVATKNAPKPASAFDRGRIPGKERVLCLDEKTGKEIWHHEYDCAYTVSYPAGPRTTPTVDGDRVYTLGAEGHLFCFNVADGKILWQRLLSGENAPTPMWGFAGHPLVDGDKLICLTADADATVTAFDKLTGKPLWRALPAKEPGYAPPMIHTSGGVRQLILWNPQSLNGLDPETGKVYWTQEWGPSKYGGTIMTPQFARDAKLGNVLLVSEQYDGATLLKLSDDAPKASLLWHRPERNKTVHTVVTSPVLRGGYAYGIDYTGPLVCVELATGNRVWANTDATSYTEERVGWTTAFLTPIGETGSRFIIANEHGDLVLAYLTPKGYLEVSRTHLLQPSNQDAGRAVVWSPPAYADKQIFWRNDKEMVCASLAPSLPGT